jgi:hypothetical protein
MPPETDDELATTGPFPSELISFFKEGGPKLLLVKGKSRVGKTLFLLGLAESVGPTKNSFIISTKPPEPGLGEAFPWLKVNETRDKALDASGPRAPPPKPVIQAPPKAAKRPEEEAKVKSAKDLLRGILGEVPTAPEAAPHAEQPPPPESPSPNSPDLTNLRKVFGSKEPRELVVVYRGLMPLQGERSFVALNRADRIGEKYSITLPALAGLLKEDLVVGKNASLVLVLEKPETGADTLADGIVTLKEFGQGDEFLGQLELNKLTGINVKQQKTMYNLRGGKFQVLKGMRVWG